MLNLRASPGLVPECVGATGKAAFCSFGRKTMKVMTWNEMAWEKVTSGISRKIISGTNEMIAHVPHQAIALEDTLDIDIFAPIRHDWLNGTDTYFHRDVSRS
jgi:hypothetical protein